MDVRKSWGAWQTRLGDEFDSLGVSLESILEIRKLRRSVCGAHGCSAPPPSQSTEPFVE